MGREGTDRTAVLNELLGGIGDGSTATDAIVCDAIVKLPDLFDLSSDAVAAIPKRSLVRCCAFVQHCADPEFYMSSVSIAEKGCDSAPSELKRTDFSDVMPPVPDGYEVMPVSPREIAKKLSERVVAYCVPVPGSSPISASAAEMDCGSFKQLATLINNPIPWETRASGFGVEAVFYDTDTGNSEVCVKQNIQVLDYLQQSHGTAVKINQVVDMIGYIEECRNFSKGGVELPEELNAQIPETSPPRSKPSLIGEPDFKYLEKEKRKIARIHVVYHRVIQTPWEARFNSLAKVPARTKMSSDEMNVLRGVIVDLLAQSSLHGDRMSAEYTLLAILSGYANKAKGTALTYGRVCLNIYKCPNGGDVKSKSNGSDSVGAISTFARTFEATLKQITGRVVSFPLSIESLNSYQYAPTYDAEEDILRSGILQLPNATTALIDETLMGVGTVNAAGIRNIETLRLACSEDESLICNYAHCDVSLPLNVRTIIVSESPSILRNNATFVMLPMEASNSENGSLETPLPEMQCSAFHHFVEQAATMTSCVEIDQSMSKEITDFYVKKRQSERENSEVNSTSAENLKQWLTMAAALSASYGNETLTNVRWQNFLELEQLREDRLKAAKFSWNAKPRLS